MGDDKRDTDRTAETARTAAGEMREGAYVAQQVSIPADQVLDLPEMPSDQAGDSSRTPTTSSTQDSK